MKTVLVALFASVTLLMPATPPAPDLDIDSTVSQQDQGATVGLGRSTLAQKARQALGSATAPADFAGPWLKFASTSPCGNARPGAPASDNFCNKATIMCANNADPEALGPAVEVWEAMVDKEGNPVDNDMIPLPALVWTDLGFTCFPQLVPGAENVLTMAMILQQFHDTAFAHPTVSVQPVNGRTLVNLPTYYELKWPETGFQPGEVDTTTLLGHQVQIRPALKHSVFVFGDGSTYGPTTSLGGPYPTGDIVHTYAARGNVEVRVDVTYSGQFSVDGGEWIDIPGEATVQGDPFPLEVLEAHAQLVTR